MLATIIIPVFNAFGHLKNCLESLERSVPFDTRIVLIDDASTDKRIQPLLKSWISQASSSRELITHSRNRGFVGTVNHGMRHTKSDVVLLNSDTVVTTGWIEKLADCLASDASIATATPWSNNGEIVSIPVLCQAANPPSDPDAVSLAIASCGAPEYPDMPTAVGFCMAISKRAIDKLGMFDEETFGAGYGEENDFSQRAEKAGFRNVLCDNAYVVHHGGASFEPLGLEPGEESMQRVLSKHPDYQKKVTDFIQADPFAPRRQKILRCLERSGVVMG